MDPIPIARPLIGEAEKEAVMAVMDSGMMAQGPRVAEFEKAFAQFCGAKHGVATSNGTTSLHLSLLAAGVTPGDEVITTPFSFFATGSTIVMCGAIPVFADIDPDTFNLDPADLQPGSGGGGGGGHRQDEGRDAGPSLRTALRHGRAVGAV